jgi:putative transposase
MRDELLNGEILLSLTEAKYVVDRWRMDYNHYRPHSSLSYITPAAFAQICFVLIQTVAEMPGEQNM